MLQPLYMSSFAYCFSLQVAFHLTLASLLESLDPSLSNIKQGQVDAHERCER